MKPFLSIILIVSGLLGTNARGNFIQKDHEKIAGPAFSEGLTTEVWLKESVDALMPLMGNSVAQILRTNSMGYSIPVVKKTVSYLLAKAWDAAKTNVDADRQKGDALRFTPAPEGTTLARDLMESFVDKLLNNDPRVGLQKQLAGAAHFGLPSAVDRFIPKEALKKLNEALLEALRQVSLPSAPPPVAGVVEAGPETAVRTFLDVLRNYWIPAR